MTDFQAIGDIEEWKFLGSLRNQEFELSAGRKEDSYHHYILVNLPDVKGDVKLEVKSPGHITVSGEKRGNHDLLIPFEHTFNLPEDADIAKISGDFRDELVYSIKIPKQGKLKPEAEAQKQIDEQQTRREKCEAVNGKAEGLEGLMEAFSRQIGIVVTAALAFALGVLVSRKLQSSSK